MLTRKQYLRSLLLVFFICATGLQFVTVSEAVLSNEDWNKYAQNQTFSDALYHLTAVTGAYGTVSFSGTASSSGWTWTVSTTYAGVALDLTYQGTFNAGTGEMTWTGTGTYGAEPWTASGTALFQSGATKDTVEWGETIQLGSSSWISWFGKAVIGGLIGYLIDLVGDWLESQIDGEFEDDEGKKSSGEVTIENKGGHNVNVNVSGNVSGNITVNVNGVCGTSGSGQTLAVELSTFTAATTTDGIALKWRTESEVNNIGFNVYRSEKKDGKFVKIGFVEGAGSTGMPTDYEFVDKTAKQGQVYYYYLEDIDVEGIKNKSEVVQSRKPVNKAITWAKLKRI